MGALKRLRDPWSIGRDGESYGLSPSLPSLSIANLPFSRKLPMKLSKVFLPLSASVLLASCGGGGGSSSSTTISGDSGIPTPSQAAASTSSIYADLLAKGRRQPIKFGSIFQAYSFGYSDVQSVDITFNGSEPSLRIGRYGETTFIDGNDNRVKTFVDSLSDQIGIALSLIHI